MTDIVPFDFEGNSVRTISIRGGLWFAASDVCAVLGLDNVGQALSRLDDDEKSSISANIITSDQMGGRNPAIISESGLYSLTLTSRKPSATRFKKWVTSEVLPSIRRTGAYGVQAAPDLSDPVVLIQLLTEHATKRIEAEKRADTAERQVETIKPKAAFYDQFVNADGLYNLQSAGRVLGQKPQKFIQWLKSGFLFYQGGALCPRAQYRDMGVFEVKATMVDDKARYQTFVTIRGIEYLAKRLGIGTIETSAMIGRGWEIRFERV